MPTSRPTFLGIGAPKAGTTWLWSQLNKHPDIWLAPAKEVHFFDRSPSYPSPNRLSTPSLKARLLGSQPWERPQVAWGTGAVLYNLLRGQFKRAAWWRQWTFGYYDEAWYRALFSQAAPHQACGEITPAYAILDVADIERIRAVNPEMRLIYLIRDPIERAWSGVRFSASLDRSSIDDDSTDAWIARLKSPLMQLRGDYERTLENYLQVFEPSQILIGFYDAISKDPKGLIDAVTGFLGVPEFPANVVDHRTRVNASPERNIPKPIMEFLLAEYGPLTERLAERLGSYAIDWQRRYAEGADQALGHAVASTRVPALHPECAGTT
jgi:hypothetical protein